MEIWKTSNSQSNLEKEEWNWRNQPAWLQALLQSYSYEDSMALAQRQKYRSMEQNRKPEINPVFLRVFFPLSLGGFSYACVYQYSAEYSKGPFRHLWSSFLCSLLLFGFLPADLSRLCTPRFPTLSCIRLSHLFPISQRKPFFINCCSSLESHCIIYHF